MKSKMIAISICCAVLSLVGAVSVFAQGGLAIRQGNWQGKQIDYMDREICIKLKHGISPEVGRNLAASLHAELVSGFDELGWGLIRLPAETDIFPRIDALAQNAAIEVAEPNGVLYTTGFTPNDSCFSKQWGLNNTGQVSGATAGADIKAPDAWKVIRGSSDVLIGVLDTGIPLVKGTNQLSHPELSSTSRIKLGPDIIHAVAPTVELDSTVRDSGGHGTHVAGIIGAETNNTSGVAGVAHQCKMLIVQVFTAGSVGDQTNAEAFREGVKAAVDSGAKIINYSGGSASDFAALDSGVSYAQAHNVLIVAPTGNGGTCGDPDQAVAEGDIRYPARLASSYSNVIAVGATNPTDHKTFFSRWGSQISVAAPGGGGCNYSHDSTENVFSTRPNYPNTSGRQNYGFDYGTSMAVPHVAGAAALMLSVNPSLTASELRDKLQSTADEVGGYNYNWDGNHPGHSKELGYGRINAYNAVISACGDSVSTPQDFRLGKISFGGYVHPRPYWNSNAEPCVEAYSIYKKYRWQEEYSLWSTVAAPETTRIDSSVRFEDTTETESIIDYYVTAVLGTHESSPSNTASTGCSNCPSPPEKLASAHSAKPTVYSLWPSYPNPFNPQSTIKYAVPQDVHVTLKVYDVLGREVAALVDEFKEANWYEVTFDASKLSSGLYFYRLQAGKFSDVKKMVLAR